MPTAALGDVLVVEDDAVACEVLCGLLQSDGFAARGAGDVERALTLLADRPADVVITDLHLPGRADGVDLARRLRSVATTSEVGLIAMSGAVEPEWPTVRHFDAYLRKPIDVDMLIQLTARLAQHAREAIGAQRLRRSAGDDSPMRQARAQPRRASLDRLDPLAHDPSPTSLHMRRREARRVRAGRSQ